MKNGMTSLFNQQSLERWLNHSQNRAEERVLKLLQGAGEKFVEVTRKSASSNDHSSNLRSSIGYVIAEDGKVFTENFQKSGKGTDKTAGKYKGHRLAKEASLSYIGGCVLVGVVGMEYAVAAEAKGHEVVSRANT